MKPPGFKFLICVSIVCPEFVVQQIKFADYEIHGSIITNSWFVFMIIYGFATCRISCLTQPLLNNVTSFNELPFLTVQTNSMIGLACHEWCTRIKNREFLCTYWILSTNALSHCVYYNLIFVAIPISYRLHTPWFVVHITQITSSILQSRQWHSVCQKVIRINLK